MRRFWEDRARENAAYYVDTSLSYERPDMERFFETGRAVVHEALIEAPTKPTGSACAVEIGSGLGRVCAALREHFDHVVGIDIAPSMVDQARMLVTDPAVEFRLGDGSTLAGVPDDSVDFLLTFTVFQHQTSRRAIAAYLAEAGRVLRPGGVLAAQWNNCPKRRYQLDTLKWRLRGMVGMPARSRVQNQAPFRGTTASATFMRRELERGGLVVKATKGEGTLFAWIWAAKSAGAGLRSGGPGT